MMLKHTLIASLSALGALAAAPVLALPTQTIALTGVSGPFGPSNAAVFTALAGAKPAINNAGQVSFIGTVTGGLGGTYIASGGSNQNILIAGGAIPGGLGNAGIANIPTNGVFNYFRLNDAGQWSVRLSAPAQTAGVGVFSDVSGTSSNAQRPAFYGDEAPGTGGATFAYANSSPGSVVLAGPLLNQQGQTAFIGGLTSGTGNPAVNIASPNNNSNVLYVGQPGSMTPVLRSNQPLGPDAVGGLAGVGLSPQDANYDASGNTRVGTLVGASLAFNDNGKYLLAANLQGSNVTTGTGGNSTMVATNRSGAFEIVARASQPSPDAQGNFNGTDRFAGFNTDHFAINNNGRVAFSGTMTGTFNSSSAIWSDVGTGRLHLITKFSSGSDGLMPAIYAAGDTTGTTPLSAFNGLKWGSVLAGTMILSKIDTLAFLINYGAAGTGGSGYFSYDANGLYHKIAVRGEAAPTLTGAALTFGSFTQQLTMNGRGDSVFYANLANAAGTNVGSGLFAATAEGTLMAIAQTGATFEVAPGDLRTVSSIGNSSDTNRGIWLSGGEDGYPVSLNDAGQFVYTLTFTDGTSGVFITSVPEPGAAMLWLAGLGAMATLVRRRRPG